MATSYANYTGGTSTTSAIYTVPTGKVAKIIITDMQIGANNTIYIGKYRRLNACSGIARSWYNSVQTNNNGTPLINETEDMMALRQYNTTMFGSTTPLKRTHILLAGETIYFQTSYSANIMSFTVIEEDV